MNSPFFIYSFLSTLIAQIASVDSIKQPRVTHSSRVICLLSEANFDFNGLNTAIELTAGLSTEDFYSTMYEATKLPIYFKLRILHFRGYGYKYFEVIGEKTIKNKNFGIELSDFSGTKIFLENKSISELLGLGVREKPSSGNSGLKDEQLLNCLDNINLKISFNFKRGPTGYLSMIEKISINPVSLEVPNFQTIWVTGDQGKNFPFKIEVFGQLQYFWSESLIKMLSQKKRLKDKLFNRFNKEREYFKKIFGSLFHSCSLHTICEALDVLENWLPNFNESERLVNLQSNLVQALNQNPDQLRKYYHKGLSEVFDPFSTFQDHYLKHYKQQYCEDIKCSKLLEKYLETQIQCGSSYLDLFNEYIPKNNKGALNAKAPEAICVQLDPFFNQGNLGNPYFRVDIKKINEIKQDYERSLKDIRELYEGSKEKAGSGLTGNSLKRFDFILQKFFDKQGEIIGKLNTFFIFRSDKGHVLLNYLRLIRIITGERINEEIMINPEVPQDARDSGKIAFTKSPISRFISTLAQFLEIKKFKERKAEILGRKAWILRYHFLKNFEVFFNHVRKQSSEAYFRTLPYKELEVNLQIYCAEIRNHWVEKTSDLEVNRATYAKIMSNWDSFADIIHKSVKETCELVINGQERYEFIEKFFCVVINECFGDFYENDIKLAEYAKRLGSGARTYLKAILQKLGELGKRRASKDEQEQISDLIVIGDVILKLMEHSELSWFMKSFKELLDNIMFFREEIKDILTSHKFLYHAERVKEAAGEVIVKKYCGVLIPVDVSEKLFEGKKPGEMSTNKTNSGDNEERKAETTELLGENDKEYDFKELYTAVLYD